MLSTHIMVAIFTYTRHWLSKYAFELSYIILFLTLKCPIFFKDDVRTEQEKQTFHSSIQELAIAKGIFMHFISFESNEVMARNFRKCYASHRSSQETALRNYINLVLKMMFSRLTFIKKYIC